MSKALFKITIPERGKNRGRTVCTMQASEDNFIELMTGAFKTMYRATKAMKFDKKKYLNLMNKLAEFAITEVEWEDNEAEREQGLSEKFQGQKE